MGGRVEFGAEWVGFEVGVFGNRRLVFPVGAPRFRSFLGVELNCGGVGVVARFGLATPEPMIGLEFAVGGEAGGCLELAKRIEPTSAWAVFGSFGMRVSSSELPAWSLTFRRTINWVA
jgi:hypothetical protein